MSIYVSVVVKHYYLRIPLEDLYRITVEKLIFRDQKTYVVYVVNGLFREVVVVVLEIP